MCNWASCGSLHARGEDTRFTLADGNKFTVERTSVFHELSQGTLTFEDCTKEYSDNVEYYYSKR